MSADPTYVAHLPDPAARLNGGDLLLGPVALVLVDLQRLDADPGCGVGPQLLAHDRSGEIGAYFARVEQVVLPAAQTLLAAARASGTTVVHVRVASPARNGGDLSLRYRRLGFACSAGSDAAQFLPGLEAVDGEAVVPKITSSAFVGTVLDTWLRAATVSTVVLGGVVTNGCVESTVRHGADLGYRVVLVEDACAALSESEHGASLAQLDGNFATVASASAVRGALSRATSPPPPAALP